MRAPPKPSPLAPPGGRHASWGRVALALCLPLACAPSPPPAANETLVRVYPCPGKASVHLAVETPGTIRPTRVLATVDGTVTYDRAKPPAREQDGHPIFDGTLPLGDHTVALLVDVEGASSAPGSATLQVRASHTFTVVECRVLAVEAILYDHEGPALRYVEKVVAAGP